MSYALYEKKMLFVQQIVTNLGLTIVNIKKIW